MKDIVQIFKDFFAALKDAALVMAILAIVIFPTTVKEYLYNKIGFTSLMTPLGPLPLQVRDDGLATINLLERVRQELPPNDPVNASLNAVMLRLQSSTGRAQQIVADVQPTQSRLQGWIYLGTVDPQQTAFKPGTSNRGSTPTTQTPFDQIRVGAEVTLITDVNLRGSEPLDAGDLPPVIGIARYGTRVRILQISSRRAIEPGGADYPGYRIYGRIDLLVKN